MQTTEIMKMTVPSKLADLRDVPLAERPTRSTATLDEPLGRVVPNWRATLAPAATFNYVI
jgi:hypothetical protein